MDSTRTLRVLVLASTFPRWGGDTTPPFVFELCRRLARDHAVTVLAPHAPGAARHEVMDGVRVVRYRYGPDALERLAYDGGILPRLARQPWLALLIPVFVLAQLVAIFRLRRDADVIHAHWVLPQGLLAALAGRRPLLCTAHGGDLFGLRSRLAGRLKRWTLRRVDRLAAVSETLADAAVAGGVDPAALVVAPMGVDLQHRFTPAEEGPAPGKTLLFAGRLVAKKGVDVLLEALPAVLDRHPDARLTVVGDGPERATLQTLAARLGVDSAVAFTGSVPNETLPARLRAARVVVFPSRIAADGDREGFGLVAVEAMGCGAAVVGSDLPAMREFLHDGETGLVAPAGDPQALAAAVIRLLDDPGLCARLGAAGRSFVAARYDWAVVTDTYAGLLAALAADARR